MALSDEVGTDLEQVEVIQRKFDDFQKVCFASNDVFLFNSAVSTSDVLRVCTDSQKPCNEKIILTGAGKVLENH